MLKARKKNRVVRIPDEKEDEYKKMGYTITDEEGKVIYEPQNDKQEIAALEKENAGLKEEIVALEKEISDLKNEIESLSAPAKVTKTQASKAKTKIE